MGTGEPVLLYPWVYGTGEFVLLSMGFRYCRGNLSCCISMSIRYWGTCPVVYTVLGNLSYCIYGYTVLGNMSCCIHGYTVLGNLSCCIHGYMVLGNLSCCIHGYKVLGNLLYPWVYGTREHVMLYTVLGNLSCCIHGYKVLGNLSCCIHMGIRYWGTCPVVSIWVYGTGEPVLLYPWVRYWGTCPVVSMDIGVLYGEPVLPVAC